MPLEGDAGQGLGTQRPQGHRQGGKTEGPGKGPKGATVERLMDCKGVPRAGGLQRKGFREEGSWAQWRTETCRADWEPLEAPLEGAMCDPHPASASPVTPR